MKNTVIKRTGMQNEEGVRLATNAIRQAPGSGHVILSSMRQAIAATGLACESDAS